MIFDTIKNCEKYFPLHKNFEKAFEFIKKAVEEELPVGRYELDGKNLFALVQEYTTKNPVDAKCEAHKNYIDIQYIVSGEERMEAFDISKATLKTEYNEEKDVVFFEDSEKAISSVFESGEYAIFFPWDVHKPGMSFGKTPKGVKKIVVKLLYDVAETDISKIDKNFAIKSGIEKEDVKFYNADEKPFKIHGVFRENGRYRRMPESVAKSVSEGVYALHANTAGGRVRFVTDSSYIAISAKMDGIFKLPHFPLVGSAGFDLYVDDNYTGSFVPPSDVENGYDSIIELGTCQLREITINFPLYSNVIELYIGVQESSVIKEATPYKNTKPIVYYGSSITQGACASIPGNSYQAVLSRKFNHDFINLGFSGNARAEDEMIEYIKDLDMSLFVSDYDHNSPSPEHLEKTLEKMYQAVRLAHPDLPIVMTNRPQYILNEDDEKRRQAVESVYNRAISSGDKNVYFVSNEKLTELCRGEGTVDTIHPSDFGFRSMACAFEKVFQKILQ